MPEFCGIGMPSFSTNSAWRGRPRARIGGGAANNQGSLVHLTFRNSRTLIMRRILQPVLYLALALALLPLAPAMHAQTLSKRLVLKDGSYQAVREWKVQGDRVHFYSIERSEWEDIPNELIDWNATNKYNADLASNTTPRS